jgi:predicted transcriptional regulator
MTAKSETLTIRLDPDLRERLEATIEAMPYRPTITSVVERGLLLAITEMEKMMKAAGDAVEPQGNDAKFMLRLPEALHEKVKAAAKANGRSMNTEIVRALNQIFMAE